jgi:hypothetical protein
VDLGGGGRGIRNVQSDVPSSEKEVKLELQQVDLGTWSSASNSALLTLGAGALTVAKQEWRCGGAVLCIV